MRAEHLHYAAGVDLVQTRREQASFGLALRANVPLSRTAIARPGLGYFRGIDDPMAAAKYQIVQLDLPFVF